MTHRPRMSVNPDYPSGVTNSVNTEPRTYVDPFESLGDPRDAAATSVLVENSIFALLKGALSNLEVAAGTGAGTVNTSPNVFVNLEMTLGDVGDAAQTSFTGSASAIAMTKGVLSLGGL